MTLSCIESLGSLNDKTELLLLWDYINVKKSQGILCLSNTKVLVVHHMHSK